MRDFNNCWTYVKAEILEETYRDPGVVKVGEKHIDGFVSRAYSNQTMTLGESNLQFRTRTEHGDVVVINVVNGGHSKECAESMFEEGDVIGFTRGNLWRGEDSLYGPYLYSDRRLNGYYFPEGGSQFISRFPDMLKKLNPEDFNEGE
ncbi:MAG: hypothetical protein KKF39_02435 [Nanoarchaeota archaeon]|nr:hypothetical protein [Nanoarchaeota archaeon]